MGFDSVCRFQRQGLPLADNKNPIAPGGGEGGSEERGELGGEIRASSKLRVLQDSGQQHGVLIVMVKGNGWETMRHPYERRGGARYRWLREK